MIGTKVRVIGTTVRVMRTLVPITGTFEAHTALRTLVIAELSLVSHGLPAISTVGPGMAACLQRDTYASTSISATR
jgi:hypothetical protein